jgi:hypothetical protein
VHSRTFVGTGPTEHCEDIAITVVASDVDGMEARSCFLVRRVVHTTR